MVSHKYYRSSAATAKVTSDKSHYENTPHFPRNTVRLRAIKKSGDRAESA